ncbi:PP2C family protein-serine/threonine phosphatase [Roseicyclus persicicus]|uniref:Serine/threonine-protein phosphatase n=1 Tax=Roseicyclus persicicus TaxID=2650661 RepID=A0A7X6GXY9_9RHOB|nr:protein phosphatase 2C domain-containing protein [Roseibacterium persicicum]NKX44431.1 serine/threonine-protein phosphatase [Roseibacterium persicicum]
MPDSLSFQIDAAAALAQGARTRQEDALAVAFPDGAERGFAVLSDGMGGHAAGDLASRIIVAEVFAELTIGQAARDGAGPDIRRLLRKAVDQANASLQAHAEARRADQGMGGTVIATILDGDGLHWISVGDSVLYLFRDNALSRLNADHSMAPQIDLMAAQGMISVEQAQAHPQRNCLISALTGDEIEAIDCPDQPLRLREGDVVILASDGLQFLPDPIIEAVLLRARQEDSRTMAQDLLDALARMDDPEQDNTSIVVLRVTALRPRDRAARGWIARSGLLRAWRRTVAPPVHLSQRGRA